MEENSFLKVNPKNVSRKREITIYLLTIVRKKEDYFFNFN